MIPFSAITVNDISNENVQEISKLKIGSTVFAGTDVIDDYKVRKYPIATNINYVIDNIKRIDILGFFISFSTGTANVPLSELSSEGISDSGIAEGFEGPGVIVVENKKISVKAPDNFVWGSSIPYTVAVKTNNGIAIFENDKKVKDLSSNDINNNSIPHDIVSSQSVEEWYKKANVEDNITLEYGLSKFNDDRNSVSPSEIKTFFGDDIYDYTIKHPVNTPILVYENNYKEVATEDYYTYLGSYPQYNDANRIYNAKQFVYAWNNTIIPPNSTSSGLDITDFATSADAEAPGGGASHGVCPPARALQAAVLSNNLPLPRGMTGEFEAVAYGFNPGSGIKVTNTGDVPLKIVMWTEGKGTSMILHAKLVKYVPNS